MQPQLLAEAASSPDTAPSAGVEETPYRFSDRELSWLAFNARVLQEAADPSVPLFERLNFLAIYSSNLDEFFRVRVASLRRLAGLKKKKIRKLSMNPGFLLREIHRTVHDQQQAFGECLRGSIAPGLERAGIHLINESAITPEQAEYLRGYFQEHVRPLLTSVMVGEGPAPLFPNGTVHLVVELWARHSASLHVEEPRFGLVWVPAPPLNRFVAVPAEGDRQLVMFLDDVIRLNLHDVFPDFTVGGAYAVKLSRDAELEFGDEFAADIRKALEEWKKTRDSGVPSRFLYDMQASFTLISTLKEWLGLENQDLMVGGRYHNLNDFRDFPRWDRSGLSYPPWPPLRHPRLEGSASILRAVAERDQVLHFPYQSFEYVIRFLAEAARDPAVEEIFLTVYRVSRDSRVLAALLDAAERGKKVRVFFEVKARFDEASNAEWAERLQRAGAMVLFSLPSIKVHAKLAHVVRREHGERRLYSYVGTGNFNERTAQFYTDIGLLTSDPRITNDVETVFRYLANELQDPVFPHLLVAPVNLRETLYRHIDAEIAAAEQGRPCGITLKLNALEDHDIIGRLYDASRAGVPIHLIVRGICCLIPGAEGLSETVHARSIVDRYLEHSRIYLFHGGGAEPMFIGSADWMTRNLSHRVEVVVPLYDADVRAHVRELLRLQLADDTKARIIDERGSNRYVPRGRGTPVRAQEATRAFLRRLTEERP